MFEVLSILLREGIEMILLLGIIILYLEKTNRKNQLKYVYAGTIVAIILSVITAYIFNILKIGFSQITEAILFFITAILVLTVILWFHYGSGHLTKGFSTKLDASYSRFQNLGIFLFSFLVIFREGAEMILLIMTLNTPSIGNSYIEMVIGAILLALFAYLILRGGLQINLRKFFQITTVMLIIIFVELIIHALFELMEVHVINLGEAIFAVAEYLIDGQGQIIFSGILLLLTMILLGNILFHHYKNRNVKKTE